MANYRRNFVAGGSFFFTVNLADRRSRLLTDKIDLLRGAIKDTRARLPFILDAIVVLPDHLHAIWTLRDEDDDYAIRWRTIKSAFSRGIEPTERRSTSRMAKGERGIWQRRYWEHTLKDERDFERHCDYIHFNPVKHGYVGAAKEWAFSSFHQFVERGVYPVGWGERINDDESDFGER
jgi:putative transposase